MTTQRILAIDDSVTVLQQLEVTLTGAGYEVTTATDGVEGLAKCEGDAAYDLFIIDVNMPNLGGLELTEKLRAIPRFRDTPVFILTTESSPQTALEGRRKGATAWIVKPFEREVLLAGVQAVLEAAT